MAENNSKINVKVGDVEFSIEGPADFVTKQYREMEKKLGIQERVSGSTTKSAPKTSKKSSATKSTTKKSAATKSTAKKSSKKPAAQQPVSEQARQVAEWMKQVPKKLKNTDKALIAAYLNQLASGENTFRVRDVTNTLRQHAIKVSNPSNLMRNAEKARNLVEQVSKEGRQAHYRFTKEGVEYVRKKFPGIGSQS